MFSYLLVRVQGIYHIGLIAEMMGISLKTVSFSGNSRQIRRREQSFGRKSARVVEDH
jgi:hypothetical protein